MSDVRKTKCQSRCLAGNNIQSRLVHCMITVIAKKSPLRGRHADYFQR